MTATTTPALISGFPELNPRNYTDDDVNALNAWGIAAHAALEAQTTEIVGLTEQSEYRANLYRSARNEIEELKAERNTLQAEVDRLTTLARGQHIELYNARLKLAELEAAPVAQNTKERDDAFEAVRRRLTKLRRYSFFLIDGNVRRVPDRSGRWIEFVSAHELFDPVEVDAAIAAVKSPEPARPINCGTGHCSCVECLFEKPPEPKAPVPDCRTCEHLTVRKDNCFQGCVSGNKHKESARVVVWRSK